MKWQEISPKCWRLVSSDERLKVDALHLASGAIEFDGSVYFASETPPLPEGKALRCVVGLVREELLKRIGELSEAIGEECHIRMELRTKATDSTEIYPSRIYGRALEPPEVREAHAEILRNANIMHGQAFPYCLTPAQMRVMYLDGKEGFYYDPCSCSGAGCDACEGVGIKRRTWQFVRIEET